MLVVGLVLLFCGTARAGTYEVWSCADAAGKPAPTEGWAKLDLGGTGVGDSGAEHADGCAAATGLYVGFNGRTISNAAAAGWTFKTPADTTLESYRMWRSVVSNQVSGNITLERIGVSASSAVTSPASSACPPLAASASGPTGRRSRTPTCSASTPSRRARPS